jgi:tetratricopeptide (TPR) repeat protein
MSDIERWKSFVEQDANNELARFKLAQCYAAAGMTAPAVAEYEACVKLKPDWMVAFIELGQQREKLGDLAGARAALQAALDLAIAQRHSGPQDELTRALAALPA